MKTTDYDADLRQLVYAYCHAVDRKDLSLLRQLYTDDAVHDHGGLFRGGADAFVKWLKPQLATVTTQHFVGNCLFAVKGDYAEGEIYTVNYHRIERDGQYWQYNAGGRYLDSYQKTRNGWLISHRQRVLDWAEERPLESSETAQRLGTAQARELPLLTQCLEGNTD